MDEELVVAGWDFCSRACADEVFTRAKMPGHLDDGLRTDGTYRIMEILDPTQITDKQIDRMGKAPRPVGLRCPVCGQLLPQEGDRKPAYPRAV